MGSSPGSETDAGRYGHVVPEELADRRRLKERLAAELRSQGDRMRETGRYAYEGGWLTRQEIVARIRARRRREWALLLERILLLMGLCGLAFVLYKLVLLLA